MRKPTRPREVGRGERVLPGVWRLRLPLPWPGVPALQRLGARGGRRDRARRHRHARARLARPARARARPGRPAARARAAARLHPRARRPLRPGGADRRARRLRAVGAPQPRSTSTRRPTTPRPRTPAASRSRARAACRSSRRDRGRPLAAGPLHPDRDLVPGVEIETDLGAWSVHETPGHAPSHVCLFQPERRLLISGDHLLGRVSLYFDYGWSPDPVGEFLSSLDVTDALDARLALSGHGRPFSDVREHIDGQPPARAASASTRSWPRSPAARAPPTTSLPARLRRGVHARASRAGC